jgi:hypothetical protein
MLATAKNVGLELGGALRPRSRFMSPFVLVLQQTNGLS